MHKPISLRGHPTFRPLNCTAPHKAVVPSKYECKCFYWTSPSADNPSTAAKALSIALRLSHSSWWCGSIIHCNRYCGVLRTVAAWLLLWETFPAAVWINLHQNSKPSFYPVQVYLSKSFTALLTSGPPTVSSPKSTTVWVESSPPTVRQKNISIYLSLSRLTGRSGSTD